MNNESNPKLDIEQRVALSIAIGNHVRAFDRLNDAQKAYQDSCCSLRELAKSHGPMKMIANVSGSCVLIVSDKDGNFDLEQIDSL